MIAMELQDTLRELGVGKSSTAPSVEVALSLLKDGHSPDWAILDYDLNGEASDPVAHRLGTLGIPFVLASGFKTLASRQEELGASWLLTKPYTKQDLRELVAKVKARGDQDRSAARGK